MTKLINYFFSLFGSDIHFTSRKKAHELIQRIEFLEKENKSLQAQKEDILSIAKSFKKHVDSMNQIRKESSLIQLPPYNN